MFRKGWCFASHGMQGNTLVLVTKWRVVVGRQGSAMTSGRVRSGIRPQDEASLAQVRNKGRHLRVMSLLCWRLQSCERVSDEWTCTTSSREMKGKVRCKLGRVV